MKPVLMLTICLNLIFAAPVMGMQTDRSRQQNFSALQKIAAEQGHVRVLVKMDVPDIRMLTTTSAKRRAIDTNDAAVRAADQALSTAISEIAARILDGLAGMDFQVNRQFLTLPLIALTVHLKALDHLSNDPRVIDMVQDLLIAPPEFGQDAAVSNAGNPRKLAQAIDIIGAKAAWDAGMTGKGWYVAILDTGIRATHEMFQGKPIVEQCYAAGEDPWDVPMGDCPNGRNEMSGPGSAAPYAPRFGHGTHVAGIAAGNNGTDRFGVAKGAGIIMVQVFSFFEDWNDVGSWFSDQLKGLEFIYLIRNQYKIASVNMSIGGGIYQSYCDTDIRAEAINNLWLAGIPTVIASGNDGYCDSVNTPACVPKAITVNATDDDDQPYRFGNWHNVMLDFLAPGVSIISAISWDDVSYGPKTGTSMAAPQVAGAWALFKQYNAQLTIDQVYARLRDTGKMIANENCELAQTKPRIDLSAVFIPVEPARVPTLSETGMLIFSLLIAGLAIVAISKRVTGRV